MPHINEDGLSQPLLPTMDSRTRKPSVPLFKMRRGALNRFVYISICVAILVVTGLGGLYVASAVVYHKRKLYQHPVFPPVLNPLPVFIENLVEPVSFFVTPGLDELQRELEGRYASIGMDSTRLECPAVEKDKYQGLGEEGPYLFALNLYNSQVVLSTLASTLLAVSDHLGAPNVHISIFENGSQDLTKTGLVHFAAVLTAGSIPHTIRSDSRRTDWEEVDRIAQLSVFRNLLLSPLERSSERSDDVASDGGAGAYVDEREFTTVAFINDVFACPGDVLKLLWEKRENRAHAACAMDWRKSSWFGWGDVKFYDNCQFALSLSRSERCT